MKKDTKKQTIEDLKGQLARAVADYQNLQKRVERERQEWAKLANKELILRILPVLDTLMLAQNHTKDPGIEATVLQFLDVLKSERVERIETRGKTFDPKIMECVETDTGEEGKVIAEIRAGYTLNGEPLRVAQVTVGREGLAASV